jgi:hypothetical protein
LHRPEKGGRITLRPGNDGRRHEARLRVRAVELGRLSSEDVIRGETPRAGVADDADHLGAPSCERGGRVSGTKGQRSQLLKELMALHGWTFFAS